MKRFVVVVVLPLDDYESRVLQRLWYALILNTICDTRHAAMDRVVTDLHCYRNIRRNNNVSLSRFQITAQDSKTYEGGAAPQCTRKPHATINENKLISYLCSVHASSYLRAAILSSTVCIRICDTP